MLLAGVSAVVVAVGLPTFDYVLDVGAVRGDLELVLGSSAGLHVVDVS